MRDTPRSVGIDPQRERALRRGRAAPTALRRSAIRRARASTTSPDKARVSRPPRSSPSGLPIEDAFRGSRSTSRRTRRSAIRPTRTARTPAHRARGSPRELRGQGSTGAGLRQVGLVVTDRFGTSPSTPSSASGCSFRRR
jgi:hypothetical protein